MMAARSCERDAMSEAESCPVCMETLQESGDDALKCANGHRTCLSCAGKMIRPCVGECKPESCTGLVYTCPLCKRRSTVRPPYLLAVLQVSWEKAHGLLESNRHRDEWFAKCSRVVHVSVRPIEGSSSPSASPHPRRP